MIEYKDLTWIDNKLYLGKKDTGFRIISYIMFPDNSLSKDHYNYSRARDNAKKEALSILNDTAENGT